jgi:hypothetical protein
VTAMDCNPNSLSLNVISCSDEKNRKSRRKSISIEINTNMSNADWVWQYLPTYQSVLSNEVST